VVKKAHISERNPDMGAKNGKPPLLKKVKFFAKKIRLTLEENICVQKDYFRETKKNWGWG